MDAASKPRRTPCASCPYRTAVASGIWHEEEYAKLERYDLNMADQPPAVFVCHQGRRDICAGWLGHGDPADLLAVRLGVISGEIDAACLTYETSAPLFASGAEAAAHGRREIEHPARRQPLRSRRSSVYELDLPKGLCGPDREPGCVRHEPVAAPMAIDGLSQVGATVEAITPGPMLLRSNV